MGGEGRRGEGIVCFRIITNAHKLYASLTPQQPRLVIGSRGAACSPLIGPRLAGRSTVRDSHWLVHPQLEPVRLKEGARHDLFIEITVYIGLLLFVVLMFRLFSYVVFVGGRWGDGVVLRNSKLMGVLKNIEFLLNISFFIFVG